MSLSAVHNKTIQQPLSICSLFFSLVVDSAFPSLLSVMITWWIQWKHQSSSNLDGYILMSVPKQGFCTLFPYTLQDEGAKWNWKCDKSTFQNFNHDLLLNLCQRPPVVLWPSKTTLLTAMNRSTCHAVGASLKSENSNLHAGGIYCRIRSY